jgi:hypothetical protein
MIMYSAIRYLFLIFFIGFVCGSPAVFGGDGFDVDIRTFNLPNISSVSLFTERHPEIPLTVAGSGVDGQRKNPAVAVLYSLLVPGLGEWYADNFSAGRYLLGSEITLWLSLYGFHSYGTWLKTDAHSFAEVYAGADISGKDKKFFVNVGNFLSRDEYNQKKLRDRDIASLYIDPSYDWQWESDDKRREYRDLRVRSDQMLNAVKFVGAAIVANHLVSAIIAGNSAIRYNQRFSDSGMQAGWSFTILPLQNGFVAGVQHTF